MARNAGGEPFIYETLGNSGAISATVPPERYADNLHPLAYNRHPNAASEEQARLDADRLHALIVSRMRAALDYSGRRISELAPTMPTHKGGRGLSERRTRQLLYEEPERMTIEQARAVCDLTGCTLDYLRGVTLHPERGELFADPEMFAELYRTLQPMDRATLWRVALSMADYDVRERLTIKFQASPDATPEIWECMARANAGTPQAHGGRG